MATMHTYAANGHRWMKWAGLAVLAVAPGWLRAEDAPSAGNTTGAGVPFTEAKITEVVNQVDVVDAQSLAEQPAKADETFLAPNLLKTGRRSRAQLTAEDGTIARVGSNSVFSFEPKSRTINLQQGSVLFNSPPGHGGGTIVTNSATATVLGTTLMVAATNNGGFKVLMLEGHGSIKLPGGQLVTLTAGQMSFVLPGVTNPDGSKGPPRVGPVVNFDLNREQQGSDLVHGFTMALPSMDKVEAASSAQQKEIQNGTFVSTDKAVVGAVDINSIVVVDSSVLATATSTNPSNPNNPNSGGGGPNPAVVAALGTDYDFRNPPIPDGSNGSTGLIFTSPPVVFTASDLGLPNGLIPGNQISVTGVIGGNLTAGGTTDLSSVGNLKEMDIFAGGVMGFTLVGSTTFTGLGTASSLVLYAETFTFTPADEEEGMQVITADFGADASGTNFVLNSISGTSLSNVELNNPTGSVQLGAITGDANLDSSNMIAGAGTVFLGSTLGSVAVTDGSLLSASGGSVNVVSTLQNVDIEDSTLQATASGNPSDGSGKINIQAGDTATVTNGALLADTVNVSATNQIAMDNVNFSTTAEIINMQARTVVLANINFASGTIVNLRSANGLLAPNPNTGATPVPGDVNFIRNVTKGGLPAQDFVAPSRGGTGLQPTTINIGTLGGLGGAAAAKGPLGGGFMHP